LPSLLPCATRTRGGAPWSRGGRDERRDRGAHVERIEKWRINKYSEQRHVPEFEVHLGGIRPKTALFVRQF
jgi:hypothetical protein